MCDCEYGGIVPPPMEADGVYALNFNVSKLDSVMLDEIDAFFQKYGYVVLSGVVSEDVVDACEAEMMATAGIDPEADLERVNWSNVYGSKYNAGKGFVGFTPALGPASVSVRQSESILQVYQRLLGRKDLWAKIDRFGLMRPTNVHADWATETGFVHWDQNPTIEWKFSRIQGVFTLSEHTLTSGGFHCIPGSNHWFQQYGETIQHGISDGDLIPVKGDCLLKRHVFRIPCPRGSLIVFDSRTAHGNWPNQGTAEWRKVLYMTYFPQPDRGDLRVLRHVQMSSPSAFSNETKTEVMSEAGRKLFALEDYEDFGEQDCRVDLNAAFSDRQNGISY